MDDQNEWIDHVHLARQKMIGEALLDTNVPKSTVILLSIIASCLNDALKELQHARRADKD